MPKTHITVEFKIPTTSMSRIQDVLGPILKAVEEHRGEGFFTTIRGPILDDEKTEAKANGKREDAEERTRSGRVERDGDAERSVSGDDRKSVGDDGDDGDKPKRGRGRPRKSDGDAPEARSSERKRDRDAEDASGAEGSEHDEPKRTRKGSDEGASEGRSRSRSTSGSGDDQRGNREASRVKDDGDDWGDEDSGDNFEEPSEEELEEAAAKSSKAWPDSLTPDPEEIDKPYITKLLGDHYNATGGKDRTLTFDLMDEVCETRKLGEVDEKDYVRLAKALLKDIARYKYGVKKAK